MRLRSEQIGMLRGVSTAKPGARGRAISEMKRSEQNIAVQLEESGQRPESLARWRALGPSPIPVGGSTTYSGRISSIAVHPTNPNIVYAGAAQGGVYRSLDGGANWTPLMDDADAFDRCDRDLAVGPVDRFCRHRRNGFCGRQLFWRRRLSNNEC